VDFCPGLWTLLHDTHSQYLGVAQHHLDCDLWGTSSRNRAFSWGHIEGRPPRSILIWNEVDFFSAASPNAS
jgi:hypothetical protein